MAFLYKDVRMQEMYSSNSLRARRAHRRGQLAAPGTSWIEEPFASVPVRKWLLHATRTKTTPRQGTGGLGLCEVRACARTLSQRLSESEAAVAAQGG